MNMKRITVKSNRREELLDVTGPVRKALKEFGCASGTLTLYVPHTTAAVTINEGADPDVAQDILDGLEKIAPRSRHWRHTEGNADAHLKASLIGSSVIVIVENGDLALGTWQKIFFCEFDGPRTRTVFATFTEAVSKSKDHGVCHSERSEESQA